MLNNQQYLRDLAERILQIPANYGTDQGDAERLMVIAAEMKYLQRDADMLSALEAGGVDNWEWYSESLEDFWDKDDDS